MTLSENHSSEAIEDPTNNARSSNDTRVEPILQSIEGADDTNPELDKSHGDTESLDLVVDQSHANVTTGLSFFQSPEELEAESTYLSQTVIAGMSSLDQNVSPRKMRPFSDPGLPITKPASVIEGNTGVTADSLTLSTPQIASKSDSTPSTDSGLDKHLSEGETVEGLESVEVVARAIQEQTDGDSGCSIENQLALKEQEQVESEEDQQQQPDHQRPCLSENDMADVKCSSAVASGNYVIPPFYFPMGKPLAASKCRERILVALVG